MTDASDDGLTRLFVEDAGLEIELFKIQWTCK